MSADLFLAENLCKFFRASGGRTVRAVDEINLAITAGSFTALSGPSGSGKTTLLSLLGCLDRPSKGTLKYQGRDISRSSDVELGRIRRTMGFLFQEFALVPRLNLIDNIGYPLIPRGVPHGERRRRALELLDRLQLSQQARQRPEELSGGERQRVAFARALAGDPTVLLADEPTSNLDADSGRLVINLLGALHESGTTVVVSTHDPELIAVATHVIHLEAGRVVMNGQHAGELK